MKKNLILIAGLCTLIFSSCKTSELSSFEDDIYKNPVEELQIARAKQAAEARALAEENARVRQEALAKKEADDNNPYYQDPKENADDYYDYKYASRINRFSNPVSGAGYYDSRYTNYYTYNQNPMMFGSSIYSSYNWMPSSQFNNYSMGISMGYNSFGGGYAYSPFGNSYYGSFGRPYYDPFNPYGFGSGFGYGYGYSPYGFSSFNSFGYDPFYSGYSMGYHQGFYNGYNSGGWGYFNSFDANSGYSQMVNAPRGSNGGGNSAGRGEQPRGQAGGDRQQFMQSMAEQQRNTPRFSESNRSRSNGAMPANVNNNGSVYNGGDSRNSNPRSSNSRDNNSRDNGQQQSVNPNINPNTSNPQRRESRERVESQPVNVSPQQTPSNNNRGGGSGGGNSSGGGSSSPRGGGGGGNSGGGRPR